MIIYGICIIAREYFPNKIVRFPFDSAGLRNKGKFETKFKAI